MKLCMIGTGYVGLVSGTCFSDIGNTVYCVDSDKSKIDNLIKGAAGQAVQCFNIIYNLDEKLGFELN